MKLEQLIALKNGSQFLYHGLPAIILNHDYSPKENTGSIFDAPMHLIIHFEVTNTDNTKFTVVLFSMYPDPKTLTFKDYAAI